MTMVKVIRRPLTDINGVDVFGNGEVVKDEYAIDIIEVGKEKAKKRRETAERNQYGQVLVSGFGRVSL